MLHEIFEAQARLSPDSVAIRSGEQAITYGELDALANQFARYLRKRGIRRGTSVAMLLQRSVEAYWSILGILKAGAAYLPIDPDNPPERIGWILENSGAEAVVANSDLAGTYGYSRGAVIRLDAECKQIAAESADPLPSNDYSARSDDLCYVIYTSGSTGRPKGVMVEHRNARHLVEAEAGLFNVRREDRVHQGASLSFDLSVEEMWLAFAAGATLVPAPPGIDLTQHIEQSRITVLSCVPTLLSMLDRPTALPALRLLILGGEACPKYLADRWARPGRRIVNTYGPTETTVIATYAEVSRDKPITIGRAVPGYQVEILDEQLRPVPHGEVGEICISGAGVTRGYLGLPAETGVRFVPDWRERGRRMYRSGDLGRLDREGNIEFLGRADGQVKLRGLRIELGEIESALLRDETVRAAACAIRESEVEDARIIACVVPRDGRQVDSDRLRSHVRNWLPHWMTPASIEIVSELPCLPNGKLDRSSLPASQPRGRRKPVEDARAPAGSTERKLIEVWSALFDSSEITVDADFFLDLGGHSLRAARMVSDLRDSGAPGFATVTLRDVYTWPTISRLASEIDSRFQSEPIVRPETSGVTASRLRHFLCGAAQTASLYFVFAVRGFEWITPWLVYVLLLRDHSGFDSVLWSLASAAAILPIVILIAVCAKWTLLGRVRPGRYPLWGGFYLRWWFVQTLMQTVPLNRLGGTPLLPFVYRLFGVSVGKDVHIASGLLAAFDVISIGDGASVDEGASLLGYTVENGALVIGPVSIGRRCLVATRSVLSPDTVMEDGARLEDLSLLPSGTRIRAGETWSGSPARRSYTKHSEPAAGYALSRVRFAAVTMIYAALALVFPLIELAAFVPGVAILTRFNPEQALFYAAAPFAGACFILTVTAEVVLLKRLLVGRARAGRYRVHGSFYLRNWIVEQLLALSLEVAAHLHATIFLKPWYRALGARLGRFVELSNASVTTPDLIHIDEDCTIADEVSLGASRVENGWLTLADTYLGRRAFVGNSTVIPAGTTLGAGSLTGVLTVAPADCEQAARNGASWLGSPPFLLVRRQPAGGFSEQSTFRPGRKAQWARGCWELFRVTLPGAGFVVATVAALDTIIRLWNSAGAAVTLTLSPAIFAACCAAVILAVVPVKWIVVGRYQPFERPFWSAFVWRLELVNALFEFLAVPIGLEALRGTPLLAWYLRLLGCGIGKGTYIDSAGFLEFDLIDVGDRAILNRDCILQTHLFEDRILKGSRLRVGTDCEIGTQSIVLYETEMKDGARLGPLSLLMKGESLPAGQVWTGSPLENSHAGKARGMVA